MKVRIRSLLVGLGTTALFVATSARASSITADGVTYSLTESSISSTVEQFTLAITGINGTSDTEKGRYGVNAFAFNPPADLVSGSATGFAYMGGGLDAGGCNGNGNFFCFKANSAPTGPALAANSSLQFTFDLTAKSASDFVGYDPDFKIDWLGTKNHYDLVSESLAPSVVPLPATLPLFLSGIAALGFMRRRKSS